MGRGGGFGGMGSVSSGRIAKVRGGGSTAQEHLKSTETPELLERFFELGGDFDTYYFRNGGDEKAAVREILETMYRKLHNGAEPNPLDIEKTVQAYLPGELPENYSHQLGELLDAVDQLGHEHPEKDEALLFSSLSDEQKAKFESVHDMRSMQMQMDFNAISQKSKDSKINFLRGSKYQSRTGFVEAPIIKSASPLSRKPSAEKRSRIHKFKTVRNRPPLTEPPKRCCRGGVCKQKDLVFSPMRTAQGKLKRSVDGKSFLFRRACDACSEAHNVSTSKRKAQKKALCPPLPDSVFMIGQPMPPYCYSCSNPNKFSKNTQGCWKRSCDSCLHAKHIAQDQVRKDFLTNGNQNTHRYCYNCCKVEEIALFSRPNVFGTEEINDTCNPCFDRLVALGVPWDKRALCAMEST